MEDKKVGMFLGKFAPFHKGHQFVVETALKEVDELVVMIYDCPETIDIPLEVRADWIKKLYPQVTILEALDGPRKIGITEEIRKMHQDYAKKILKGKKITHFYSSEFYGDHMSKALKAKNCLIDEDRNSVPISATKIRGDPYKSRNYLDPIVYKDFVTKVVFLGGPSTGKTTISKALAEEYNTKWMPEYGREYWEKNQVNRRLTLKQLGEIAKGHIEREDKLIQESNGYLFIDTNAITTYLFSLYYHGRVDPSLKQIAEEFTSRYDFVFLCDDDFKHEDTWDRSGDVNREFMQKQTISYLIGHKIPFILLSGSIKERIKTVRKMLNGFRMKNLNSLLFYQHYEDRHPQIQKTICNH